MQVSVVTDDAKSRDVFFISLVDTYRKLSQIPKLTERSLDVIASQEDKGSSHEAFFLPFAFVNR